MLVFLMKVMYSRVLWLIRHFMILSKVILACRVILLPKDSSISWLTFVNNNFRYVYQIVSNKTGLTGTSRKIMFVIPLDFYDCSFKLGWILKTGTIVFISQLIQELIQTVKILSKWTSPESKYIML